MKAGRIVQTILHLAGFKNVKSKVTDWPKKAEDGPAIFVFALIFFFCLRRLLVKEILIIQLRLSSKRLMRLVTQLADVVMLAFQLTFTYDILVDIACLFQIETPKDVQEKFGRTVVEKYLLWWTWGCAKFSASGCFPLNIFLFLSFSCLFAKKNWYSLSNAFTCEH